MQCDDYICQFTLGNLESRVDNTLFSLFGISRLMDLSSLHKLHKSLSSGPSIVNQSLFLVKLRSSNSGIIIFRDCLKL